MVVETGPGLTNENGVKIPINVKSGETVLLPEYGGTKVKIGEEELLVYRDSDIIAKLE